MPPRAPEFWGPDSSSFLRFLLLPFAFLFGWGGRIRQARGEGWQADVPVICVGNLVAGGAGKTPVAIALSQLPSLESRNPHFLSRGYGGSLEGPLQIDITGHDSTQVGDEPLLLGRYHPCWISRDRAEGAKAAMAAGAGSIIMDDGYQNPGLDKDISALVVDGAYGFGNGKVMPAGPLRETIPDGLARADFLVLLGDDEQGVEKLAREREGEPLPVVRARLVSTGEALALAGRRVLVFAGIARPEKVFDSLRKLGCDVIETVTFPDHHPYSRAEVEDLLARAEAAGATAVTTPKDLVRIPDDLQSAIAMSGVSVIWDEPEAVEALISGLLQQKKQQPANRPEQGKERPGQAA